jgi:ABC-2 type transport system ATP-binding protein
VLDEPTTGLDPVSRLELWSFITLSAREGRAVLVSSTYVDEADRGDTVLALDEGRVLASGGIAQIVVGMRGRLFVTEHKHDVNSWRRGDSWRTWSPDGAPIPDAREIEPDLSDVVTVAALAGEQT